MSKTPLIISVKKNYGETSVVTARIPNAFIEKIEQIAKDTGRTKNEIISMCIEFALENIEIKNEKEFSQ